MWGDEDIPVATDLQLADARFSRDPRGAADAAAFGLAFDTGPTQLLWRAGKQFVRESALFADLPSVDSDVGKPLLTPAEANDRFGIDGALTFDRPVHEAYAAERWAIKQTEIQRQDTIARSSLTKGAGGFARTLAFSMTGGVADPIMLGVGFLPLGGLASLRSGFLAPLAAAEASANLGTRLAARGTFGAIEGAIGAAALEPIVYPLARYREGRDYSLWDSAINVAGGALLGGLGGAFARHHGPDTADLAVAHAVGAVADGQPVNVEAVLREAEDLRAAGADPDALDDSLRSFFAEAAGDGERISLDDALPGGIDRFLRAGVDAEGRPRDPDAAGIARAQVSLGVRAERRGDTVEALARYQAAGMIAFEGRMRARAEKLYDKLDRATTELDDGAVAARASAIVDTIHDHYHDRARGLDAGDDAGLSGAGGGIEAPLSIQQQDQQGQRAVAAEALPPPANGAVRAFHGTVEAFTPEAGAPFGRFDTKHMGPQGSGAFGFQFFESAASARAGGRVLAADLPAGPYLRLDRALDEQAPDVRTALADLDVVVRAGPDGEAPDGAAFYAVLSELLGSDEAASAALQRAGVVGAAGPGRGGGMMRTVFPVDGRGPPIVGVVKGGADATLAGRIDRRPAPDGSLGAGRGDAGLGPAAGAAGNLRSRDGGVAGADDGAGGSGGDGGRAPAEASRLKIAASRAAAADPRAADLMADAETRASFARQARIWRSADGRDRSYTFKVGDAEVIVGVSKGPIGDIVQWGFGGAKAPAVEGGQRFRNVVDIMARVSAVVERDATENAPATYVFSGASVHHDGLYGAYFRRHQLPGYALEKTEGGAFKLRRMAAGEGLPAVKVTIDEAALRAAFGEDIMAAIDSDGAIARGLAGAAEPMKDLARAIDDGAIDATFDVRAVTADAARVLKAPAEERAALAEALDPRARDVLTILADDDFSNARAHEKIAEGLETYARIALASKATETPDVRSAEAPAEPDLRNRDGGSDGGGGRGQDAGGQGADRGAAEGGNAGGALDPRLFDADPDLREVAASLDAARAEVSSAVEQGLLGAADGQAALALVEAPEKSKARYELARAAAFCLRHAA